MYDWKVIFSDGVSLRGEATSFMQALYESAWKIGEYKHNSGADVVDMVITRRLD